MDIFNTRHAEDYKNKHCGTVCCIAGALTEFHSSFCDLEMMEVGAEIGLNWDEASNLFFGESEKYNMNLHYIKPDHAARTIRHFLSSGVIDWKKTATEADELAFEFAE